MDTGRIGAAVSGAGVDSREWGAVALVLSDPRVEPGVGYLCRVRLLMTDVETTAAIATGYAGGGFGAHAPIRKDDQVLVQCPGGLPDGGYYVVGRYWCKADPPPQQVVDHPEDVHLVVAPGESLRVVVSGGGNVEIEASGAGRIDLTANEVRAGAAPVQRMILGDAYRGAEDLMLTAVSAAITLIASIPGLTAPQIAVVTAATGAITTFQTAATSYLAVHGKVS